MESDIRSIIIIGSGPAGLTAAIYAGRAGLKPLVIAGYQPGGQLMKTTVIENYPGFIDGIDGPELMNNMMLQAQKWGAEFVYADAEFVDLGGDIKKVRAEGKEYLSKAVILATGATPRKLNVPGEEQYWGMGVSSCATCDGALYRGKTVAVIGGGDSAMEEASFLTNHVAKVYVIHRRDKFSASEVMQQRVLNNPKIEVIWNTTVYEIAGDGQKVTHLKLNNIDTQTASELPVDGMFLAIGHIPVTGFLSGITLDPQGYVQATEGVHTNIAGVFVAGDVEDHEYRQAITAAGQGCAAAMTAQKWLLSR
jgi:thioredoxin reductase (NADPH)